MSPSMPEFEMPTGVDEPLRPEAMPPAASSGARAAHTAEPEASDDLTPQKRVGINWRHVMVAAVVGALVGAALPGGIQLAERAAVSADQSNLRTVATEYLTAIADGRAADATAMAPVPSVGEGVPDAVLQSATRITNPAVRLVHIDGDAATVEVEYSLGRPELSRTLAAERVDGAWQITSSLAEPVLFYQHMGTGGLQIAGITVAVETPVHMYPGIYTFDSIVDDPIVSVQSSPFSVDGDPTTPSEPPAQASLRQEVGDRAGAIAVRLGEECQDAAGCIIPPDATLQAERDVFVINVSAETVDFAVSISTTDVNSMQWFQITMQIERGADGAPETWRCGTLQGTYDPLELDPCPEVD